MASKGTSLDSKITLDKAKLAIETKCSLDDIILKSQSNGTDALPNIQISGIEAVVNSLKLVDHGLCVYSSNYDISLPNGMAFWCRKLKMLRSQCIKNSTVCSAALKADKRNLGQSNQDRGIALKNWIRGTFIIPTAGPATFPKNFLTSPMAGQNKISQQYTYEERILADGTVVKLRTKPMNDMKKKKHKSNKHKHRSHDAVDTNHQSKSNVSTSKKGKSKHREQAHN